jgi:hypothetical protein
MGGSINYYIWTEIYNCGKIGNLALESFKQYHPNHIVHVYGYQEDFETITFSKNVIPIIIQKRTIFSKIYNRLFNRIRGVKGKIDDYMLQHGFENGHLGTARLWAYLIQNRKEKFLLHFDSDTVFLDNIIEEMIILSNKFDIVGPPRSYKNNSLNDNYFKNFEDTIATNCFIFNRLKIDSYSYNTLVSMCLGVFNPLGHRVIDFFDPICFNMKKNGANIYYLNHDDVGATNIEGSRNNKYFLINNFDTPFKLDYGDKLIHFSAVGSGMNFYNNRTVSVPDSYKQYAIDRYALYCKIFYGEDLGVDLSSYKILIDFFENNVLPKLKYNKLVKKIT